MPRTPLVGRDGDLDDLLELCDGARARLVTILGPGGVGKTRLALEVADRLGADGTRSAWFASLADLGRDDDVASFLAAQLQVVASAGGDTLDAVRRFLRRPQSVLVLDNVEHVSGAGAVVSSLLDHCPTLTVLTTSRVPLRLRGEHRFDLAPLDESAAVELFRQRSDAARRRRLVAAELQAMGAICELVGRTPLAIELAAARTAVLGPVALLEELRRRRSLDVLTQGPADAGHRHASLRSSLAWSYELLAPPERRVFEDLGAFDGSFTIAAVLAVCDDSAGNAAFDSLSTLVERHMVELVGEVHNETRFTLSPPVRELAHELLGVDTDEVRRRHAIHYAGIARSLARDATREPAALDRLRGERPNVLAALSWLRAAGLPTTALQLAADVAVLSFADGDMVAGRRRIEDLLANDESRDADPAARAAAQVWAARFALHEQADEPAQRAAVERFREALAQARAAGDDDLVLLALSFVGMSAAVAIDRAWTAAAVDEGYDLAERLGDRWWLAHFTIRKAMLAHQAGDLATADQLGRLALGAARALDDSRLLASVCMLFLGMPDLGGTRPTDLPTLDAVLETFEASGDVVGRIITLARMSAVALATGDVAVGASRCRDALELVKRTGQVQPAGVCVVLALAAARLSGDDPTAARLHGWVRDVLPSTRQFLTPSDLAVYDAIAAAVSRACGSEIFERLTAEGASWTWDEAVSAALATTARLAVARTRLDAPLTDRELEVLVLLAAGDTNKEIARALGVTTKTAMHHCTSIYRKLGVRGRAEAASQAHSRGWLADQR